jgi:hypothetical protein
MSDLLETVRAELDTRIETLRPFVSEYESLLANITTSEQPALSATPAPLETSPAEAGAVPTNPGSQAGPTAGMNPTPTGPTQTCPTPEASPAEAIPALIHTHRPRRILRPAWPKTPRTAGRRPA